jgi:hypothetical protein
MMGVVVAINSIPRPPMVFGAFSEFSISGEPKFKIGRRTTVFKSQRSRFDELNKSCDDPDSAG